MTLREPTSEQCSEGALVHEDADYEHRAIWYPQMGGYVGRAVAVIPKSAALDGGDPCFDVHVWHDGEFPFGGSSPRELHHCAHEQFTRFGETIAGMMRAVRRP